MIAFCSCVSDKERVKQVEHALITKSFNISLYAKIVKLWGILISKYCF